MKYYIYGIATDSDGLDLFTFNGTEEQMKEKVRAMALDFASDTDTDYEYISCGWDTFAYPVYQATVQYNDYHFTVGAIEQSYLKKVDVSRKSLYKSKKLKETDWFSKPDEDEEDW